MSMADACLVRMTEIVPDLIVRRRMPNSACIAATAVR
jgi:hypothetical protein